MQYSVGDRIAERYQVQAIAGSRPLGLLYRTANVVSGVEVALRAVEPHLLPSEEWRQYFIDRLRPTCGLKHPNLIRLIEVLRDGERVLLASEWVHGERLSRRLEGLRTAAARLPMADVRAILGQVAAGMMHAHRHGIVLGNLSPDTVMLSSGVAKLTHVGVTSALPSPLFVEAMKTRYGYFHLSPETRNGEAADQRSDVYSLGILALELVGGDLPTGDLSVVQRLPSVLRSVVGRATATDPGARYATAELFCRALAPALLQVEKQQAGARPPSNGGAPGSGRAEASLSTEGPTEATVKVIEVELYDQEPHERVTRQIPGDEIERLRVASGTNTRDRIPVGVLTPRGVSMLRLPLLLGTFAALLLVTAVGWAVMRYTKSPADVQPPPQKQLLVETKPPVAPAPLPPTPQAIVPTPLAATPCPPKTALITGKPNFCIDLYEATEPSGMPQTGVSLAEAARLCQGEGARLCTDAEWERACRGVGAASYPYGQSYDPTVCNTRTGVVEKPGSRPRCRSGSGAFDMSGNVAEWVASGARRGGSAKDRDPLVRCSHAVKSASTAGAGDVGFRCCRASAASPLTGH